MPTPKKAASPKNALSKPVQPDAALAAVVGKDPLPRTELTKKLWEYIRRYWYFYSYLNACRFVSH
jgi:upstream activation factor subunit UAF30